MKLTAFILPRCPYCLQMRELLEELRAERPELSSIEIEFIDEAAQPALADRYDYYRVPSFFLGGEKLYEASPLWTRAEAKRRLGAMFDEVLGKQERNGTGSPAEKRSFLFVVHYGVLLCRLRASRDVSHLSAFGESLGGDAAPPPSRQIERSGSSRAGGAAPKKRESCSDSLFFW